MAQFSGYWELLNHCKNYGQTSETRLGQAKEILNTSVEVRPFQLPRRMRMRRELGYMELAQLLLGKFDLAAILRVAPRVNPALFGESAIYGPRVAAGLGSHWDNDQVANAVAALREHPSSRQAIVTVADPSWPDPGVQPCITGFQFQLRRGFLFTTVNYRSCDLWFGFPHDLIVACGLAQMVQACVGAPNLGNIHVNIANAHIYTRQLDEIQGPPLSWWFSVPPASTLEDFRNWAAESLYLNEDWVRGIPPGVTENFPRVPELSKPVAQEV